jgi:SAM-dependent methyltransferase
MWNERYSGKDYFYGKDPNDFLRENIHQIQAGSRVLCLAEGEGRNAVFIACTVHQSKVTAVDGSSTGLEKTRLLASEKNVTIETVCADLNDFDLGMGQWDAIVSIWCHLPSELRKRVHAGVVRALKPNGCFLLEAYTPAQLKHSTGGPKSEDMLMTLEGLRTELNGLRMIVGQEIERTVLEGQGHTGQSAVVQAIARK